MKYLCKKVLIVLMLMCGVYFFIGNTFVNAAVVVPTEYTTISTNANNDITSYMEDDLGVFKFTNYGARFVKVTLTSTSTQTISYPNGCITVKNGSYQLVKKCEMTGFDSLAINSEGSNNLIVFLPSTGTYYIELNYDMENITKLELRVSVVSTSNSFNMFNYGESEEFSVNMFDSVSDVEDVKQFTIAQAVQLNLDISFDGTLSSNCRIFLIKINSLNSDEIITTKINRTINNDYFTTVNLIEGTYCIGYFGLEDNRTVDVNISRNITSYGSSYLIPDPDRPTPCGSQITVEEADISEWNRSYRGTNITEGFTRLMYLSNTDSRLDYHWYSSDENVAIITDYGTVLALPISVSQKTVKVMAVHKTDMSKCYIKEFTVYNDTETYNSDPIDIYTTMTVETMQYKSIDLSNLDVPINMLQYYSWSVSGDALTDAWGRVYAFSNALGTTLQITGVYQYNPKVKIHIEAPVVLPLSGYELDYDTSIWDDEVEGNNNCYAYALNNQVYPGTNNLWYKQQPGEYSDNLTFNYSNEEAMYNAVLEDFNTYNRNYGTNLTFTRINKYQKCPAGTYKVALVAVSNNRDYHWYRQDSDGYWSHKPGTTPVTRYDSSGNLIIDPETCNRGIYDVFLGFYAVSGWDNMYNESANVLLYILEEMNEELNVSSITNAQISNICIGMKYDEVITLLGTSGNDIGSGTLIEEYTTETGDIVNICYKLVDEQFEVFDIIIEECE